MISGLDPIDLFKQDPRAKSPFESWRCYQSILDGDEGLLPPYGRSVIDCRWAQREREQDRRNITRSNLYFRHRWWENP